MKTPEAKRLELAIRPLEKVLAIEGIGELGTAPITLGVIENVVLAARNLIALHAPDGTFDKDQGGELLGYVIDVCRQGQPAGVESNEETQG